MKSLTGLGRRVPGLVVVALAATMGTATRAPGLEHLSGAHSARTLGGTDTAHLRLVRQDEDLLYEEGAATGALPGRIRAQLTIGSVFAGRFTIYAAGGSITGRGRATPHGYGRYQSFSGWMLITGGSGRYAHAKGRMQLYGTFDRRTFAVVLQTVGRLSY